MMENLFKKSIFTTYVINDQHMLIVYNSMVGSSSIMKFDENTSQQILKLFSRESITEHDGERVPFWGRLVSRNIFVNVNRDELRIAKTLLPGIIDSSTLNLCILPTGQCNYRCRYCYENFKLGRMSEEIQEGIIKFVRKNIHYYTGVNVSWFGGEPLLAADIIDNLSSKLMAICNVSKRSYSASITSNGYLLDDIMLERLLNNRIYKIQISLDGLKETNDYNKPLIDGSGTFDKIIDNIVKIRNNSSSHLFHIAIRTNFTHKSIKEFDDYLSYMKNIIGDDSRFSLFLRAVNDLGGEAVDEMQSQILSENEKENLYALTASKKQQFYFTQHESCLEPGGLVCYAGKKNDLIIQSDGTISKCSCALYSPVNKIGNVIPSGTFDIDWNIHSKWIMNSKLTNECTQCCIMPLCFNLTCPASFINENDDDRKCPIEKDSLKDILVMLAKTKEIEVQQQKE